MEVRIMTDIDSRAEDKLKNEVKNPYTAISEDELEKKLKKSRESSKEGNYRSADSMIADMRERYGL